MSASREERLLALARFGAHVLHEANWMGGHSSGRAFPVPDAHLCAHPDCVLVREAASPTHPKPTKEKL
jgi:hypothetical protein